MHYKQSSSEASYSSGHCHPVPVKKEIPKLIPRTNLGKNKWKILRSQYRYAAKIELDHQDQNGYLNHKFSSDLDSIQSMHEHDKIDEIPMSENKIETDSGMNTNTPSDYTVVTFPSISDCNRPNQNTLNSYGQGQQMEPRPGLGSAKSPNRFESQAMSVQCTSRSSDIAELNEIESNSGKSQECQTKIDAVEDRLKTVESQLSLVSTLYIFMCIDFHSRFYNYYKNETKILKFHSIHCNLTVVKRG